MYPLCTQEGHNIKEAPEIILGARVKTTSNEMQEILESSKEKEVRKLILTKTEVVKSSQK